jgi:hypothetical protein
MELKVSLPTRPSSRKYSFRNCGPVFPGLKHLSMYSIASLIKLKFESYGVKGIATHSAVIKKIFVLKLRLCIS